MQNHELYLPMLIPMWGIFIGIALIIIGYADNKSYFTYAGWMVLVINGLISLYFNLFEISPGHFAANTSFQETAGFLKTTGWLNTTGAFLAMTSLLFFRFKKKRYMLLAVLTILFFSVLFFQYYGLIQKPK